MSEPETKQEREFVVHWEARVYGTYGTYATSEREAIEKAQDHCVPEREAEDRSGPIEVQFVEDYG